MSSRHDGCYSHELRIAMVICGRKVGDWAHHYYIMDRGGAHELPTLF